MKALVLVPVMLVASLALAQNPASQVNQPTSKLSSNQTVITNQDVTGMLKAGISPEVVAAKVKNSKCQCNTSPAALAELKAAGIPDSVILAMVQSTAAPTEPPSGLSDIREAKTVYLVNKGADMKVFDDLTERLQKWGRWKIVARPEQADLLLVFAENQTYFGSLNTVSVSGSPTYASGMGTSIPMMSMRRFLIAVDRASGRQLTAVSCVERRIGAGHTAGVLVNRMREQIEKSEKPQSNE